MHFRYFTYLLAAVAVLPICAAVASAETSVWPVSPLEKVFRDAAPSNGEGSLSDTVRIEAAANELEPAQLAIRSSTPLKGLKVSCGPLTSESGVGDSG